MRSRQRYDTPQRRSVPSYTLRIFFALWPDAIVRAAIDSIARDCAASTEGRATDPRNLHLTLVFLGEVAAGRISALQAIAREVSAAQPGFTLTLDRIGAFDRQGIVWLGPSVANGPVEQLARALGEALTADGFAIEDRAFHPHVTLVRRGRKRVQDSVRVRDLTSAAIVWDVAGFALVASEPGRGSPRYVVKDSWSLGGAD